MTQGTAGSVGVDVTQGTAGPVGVGVIPMMAGLVEVGVTPLIAEPAGVDVILVMAGPLTAVIGMSCVLTLKIVDPVWAGAAAVYLISICKLDSITYDLFKLDFPNENKK